MRTRKNRRGSRYRKKSKTRKGGMRPVMRRSPRDPYHRRKRDGNRFRQTFEPLTPPPLIPVQDRWKTKDQVIEAGYGDLSCDAMEDCIYYNRRLQDCPDDAVLFVSSCRHLFHNNCLNELCENEHRLNRETFCPRCLTTLSPDCEDVWAFKHKAFAESSVNTLTPDVREIYEAQP